MDRSYANEEVLLRINGENNILHIVKRRNAVLVTLHVETAFWNRLLKERWGEGYKWRKEEEEDVSSHYTSLTF